MMIPEPKRKWFAYAFLAAWAVAAVAAIVQSRDLLRRDAVLGLFLLLIWGTMAFPLGLPLLFIDPSSSPLFRGNAYNALIWAAWLTFVGLGVIGAWRKSRILFVIFVLLLLANDVGCIVNWRGFVSGIGSGV